MPLVWAVRTGLHLAIYDGVVNLSDHDVPVIIEIDEETVRLSASGAEVGTWPTDECDITRSDETTFLIHAEAETLPFVPTQPGAFAGAVGLSDGKGAVPLPPDLERSAGPDEAPAPKPLTVGLFYALALATGASGVWALATIVL